MVPAFKKETVLRGEEAAQRVNDQPEGSSAGWGLPWALFNHAGVLEKKREERLPGGRETRSQTSRTAVIQAGEEGEAAFLAEEDIQERAQMPERGCTSKVLEGRKLGWARNSK